MIGAIAGDIIGSVYEFDPIKTKEFPLFSPESKFTDDTVLTIAVAEAVLTDGDYRRAVLEFGRRHPGASYGSFFGAWLASSDPKPYNSWGNGSAMRISPVGFAFDDADDVLREAFYGPVPAPIRARVRALLTPDLREVTERFCARYGLSA